jgi:2,3-bisphosphoglycerate-independent phosphoglycerate mutase
MRDAATHQPHTAHTTGPVPLLFVGGKAVVEDGILADVAPTVLALMGLDAPEAMTGRSLVTRQGA